MNKRTTELITEIKSMDLKDIRTIRLSIHNFEKENKQSKQVAVTEGQEELVKFSPEAMDIAKRLLVHIEANVKPVKDPNLDDWAEDIDKIHRIDKQPFELINAAMEWSQSNGFWKRNIRSGAALRKHFEKLVVNGKGELEEIANKGGKVYAV
jgi:hypothetical protein